MKGFKFIAFVKNEKRAKQYAIEDLKEMGENPNDYVIEIKKIRFNTFEIIARKVKKWNKKIITKKRLKNKL